MLAEIFLYRRGIPVRHKSMGGSEKNQTRFPWITEHEAQRLGPRGFESVCMSPRGGGSAQDKAAVPEKAADDRPIPCRLGRVVDPAVEAPEFASGLLQTSNGMMLAKWLESPCTDYSMTSFRYQVSISSNYLRPRLYDPTSYSWGSPYLSYLGAQREKKPKELHLSERRGCFNRA